MKKKNILVVLGASAVLVVCVLIGAFFAGPLMASANSSNTTVTPPAKGKVNPYCVQYNKDLAGRLNVSTDTLSKDQIAARNDIIDQRVKDGKLTQAQANKLKQKLANAQACTIAAHPRNASILLRRFRQDILMSVSNTLNLTPAQLKQQIQSGKSIADIANTRHVSLATVRSNIITAIQNDLNTAVKHGTLTQQQETRIQTFLKNHSQFLDKFLNAHHTAKATATSK